MPGMPSKRERRLMGMRYTILLLGLFLAEALASGQAPLEGKVSYLTSQHVYVRFSSTDGLHDGDTLFMKDSRGEIPVLVILSHSSTSCVCDALREREFRISDPVFGRPVELKSIESAKPSEPAKPAEAGETVEEAVDEAALAAAGKKQEIDGRFSVSSYTYLKNQQTDGRQRLRYAFSLAARNIGGSGLTVETYSIFSHTLGQWDEIRENVFNGMKIYKLSATYAFRNSVWLTAGRRINPKLSSVGAIDGLQFEKGFGALSAGMIAGFRPDYQDYSINTGLFQYGAYLAHNFKGGAGSMQNTLAFIEQMNQGATDRRFIYIQHSNTLVRDLWFFGSVETDLYQKVGETKETVFHLYNTYLMLRYRIVSPLSLSLSYSARNNLIYYESYRDFLDRLLDEKILQGWRFRVNYRPVPSLYLGAHAAYRYRKDDPVATKNAHGYATYSGIPGIGARVTATFTWMQSAYLDGMIYGLGINREFLKGKLQAELKYHYVDHHYRSAEMAIAQHVGEAGLSWSVCRKLFLSVHYEGTFEKSLGYNRIFASLSQRF
ncbi:MAG: hypothetical protein P1P86_11785 [Bacteroidales bacterium]|nr:hypothetical protein [Bacteroidales bacterium]